MKWRTPVLESPQDGLRTPPELLCPSEALTHIQSQAGRAAAVAAATLDVEQTLQERAEFCELADTERRAFWVHRNAHELLCQASVEAEQQGGRPALTALRTCPSMQPFQGGVLLTHAPSLTTLCL